VPLTGLFILALLFGMATLPTYSIAAAHTYDRTTPGNFVETAAGILLANSAGSIIGPLLASPLMEEAGTSKLFLFTAFVQACLVIFAATRMGIQPATAPADKTEFDLAATAPIGTVMSPELPDIDDPLVVAPLEISAARPLAETGPVEEPKPKGETEPTADLAAVAGGYAKEETRQNGDPDDAAR